MQNDKLFIQVQKEITSVETEKREYERLLKINVNYPKYVLTIDNYAGVNYKELKQCTLPIFC